MSPIRPPADPSGNDTPAPGAEGVVALLTGRAPVPARAIPSGTAFPGGLPPHHGPAPTGRPATDHPIPGPRATGLRAPDLSAGLFGDRSLDSALPGDASPGGLLDGDLLDAVATWSPVAAPAGSFRLVPVRLERDLPLLTTWMNDPVVSAFWELAGPPATTAEHLRAQLEGDGRSVPCLGVLDATPMSYFEIYRADLDPLARHYPARPHDTGIHLLIGGATDRGRGLGTTLLRAVADLVLDHRPHCTRVIAEPDIRNTPSVSAFLGAGFRYATEVDLPGKRAALMIRDRALRHVL